MKFKSLRPSWEKIRDPDYQVPGKFKPMSHAERRFWDVTISSALLTGLSPVLLVLHGIVTPFVGPTNVRIHREKRLSEAAENQDTMSRGFFRKLWDKEVWKGYSSSDLIQYLNSVYTQEREGYQGKHHKVIKSKSMRDGDEPDDERSIIITVKGMRLNLTQLIKRMRVDEILNLINIIKGDQTLASTHRAGPTRKRNAADEISDACREASRNFYPAPLTPLTNRMIWYFQDRPSAEEKEGSESSAFASGWPVTREGYFMLQLEFAIALAHAPYAALKRIGKEHGHEEIGGAKIFEFRGKEATKAAPVNSTGVDELVRKVA